jgi:hypothetical protein
MFKYYAGKDGNIATLFLDNYNTENSKISVLEGQIVKNSDDYITLFAYITSNDNIVKSVKVGDKWLNDDSFKFETQVIKIELSLKEHKRETYGKVKEFKPSEVEQFITNYLVDNWLDKPFEGLIDFNASLSDVKKYREYSAINNDLSIIFM